MLDLWPYHIEALVLLQLLKLSNVKLDQYLDGRLLRKTRYCMLGCVAWNEESERQVRTQSVLLHSLTHIPLGNHELKRHDSPSMSHSPLPTCIRRASYSSGLFWIWRRPVPKDPSQAEKKGGG